MLHTIPDPYRAAVENHLLDMARTLLNRDDTSTDYETGVADLLLTALDIAPTPQARRVLLGMSASPSTEPKQVQQYGHHPAVDALAAITKIVRYWESAADGTSTVAMRRISAAIIKYNDDRRATASTEPKQVIEPKPVTAIRALLWHYADRGNAEYTVHAIASIIDEPLPEKGGTS